MMVLASAVVTPLLCIWREDVAWFFILMIAVYWCYGTQMSVFASTAADLYGDAHLGMNWGVLLTAWAVAGIVARSWRAGCSIASTVINMRSSSRPRSRCWQCASCRRIAQTCLPKDVIYGQH